MQDDDRPWVPKVVGIDGIPHAANPPPESRAALIEGIEDLLARAKAGELSGLAYVAADPRGGCYHYWLGGFTGPYTVMGALDVLKAQFMHRAFDDED